MAPIIPPKFIDLDTALKRLKTNVNIIGVVTDFQAPAPSRGTDWMCTFSLADSSYGGVYDDGLRIRFFRPMESEMPAITGKGDVVLLRLIGIKEWSGMTMGISNRETTWTIFPAAGIPTAMPSSQLHLRHVKEPRATFPNLIEMQYAFSVCNARDRSTFSVSDITPASTLGAGPFSGSPHPNPIRRDKFTLVKDAMTGMYYDLVVQVVKIYTHNDRIEVYVSDYTSNNLLFNYEWGHDDSDASGREGDEYNYAPGNPSLNKWNGPCGKMTLTVTLWPPHANFGRENLKENDFVHLRNVHIRWSKDLKIEGGLHTDRRCPDRIDVAILTNNENDDRVKDLLRRKRAYAKKFQEQSEALVAQSRATKRKEMNDGASLSKTQARKKRKREEKEQLSNPIQSRGADDKENQARPSDGETKNPLQTVKFAKQDLNPNGKQRRLSRLSFMCTCPKLLLYVLNYVGFFHIRP